MVTDFIHSLDIAISSISQIFRTPPVQKLCKDFVFSHFKKVFFTTLSGSISKSMFLKSIQSDNKDYYVEIRKASKQIYIFRVLSLSPTIR